MKYIRIFSLLGEYVPLGIGALKASALGPAFSKIKPYAKRRSRNAMCLSNVNFRRRPRTRTAATSEALSWQCEKSYIKNHHPFKAIIAQEDRTGKTQKKRYFGEGRRRSDEKNPAGRMGEHDARRTRSLESTKRTKNAGHSLLRAVSNLFCTAEAFNVKAAP